MSSNQTLMLVIKIVIIATWLAAAAGFLLPPASTFGELGRTLFFLLLAIHAIECACFIGALRRTGRPLLFEIANTLFFGAIHYAEVRLLLAEQDE
jgi:hypothetical protein